MRAAFTLDDLPVWPHSAYPEGYTAGSICEALVRALDENGIGGVYAYSNSLPLLENPELSNVLDSWVAAGHHVANHTHSHPTLNEISADRYIEDIDLADLHLKPWISKAPERYFRYTYNLWGNTDDKRERVKAHLDELGYKVAEVTTFLYEWRWNAAYEKCLGKDDQAGIRWLKQSFLEFSVAQFRYDMKTAADWFGSDVHGIVLGHNVPFFAEIASDLFRALRDQGLEFVDLHTAASDPAYDGAASVVTDKFLTYHQKLAFVAGRPYPKIAPERMDTYNRIGDIARR